MITNQFGNVSDPKPPTVYHMTNNKVINVQTTDSRQNELSSPIETGVKNQHTHKHSAVGVIPSKNKLEAPEAMLKDNCKSLLSQSHLGIDY